MSTRHVLRDLAASRALAQTALRLHTIEGGPRQAEELISALLDHAGLAGVELEIDGVCVFGGTRAGLRSERAHAPSRLRCTLWGDEATPLETLAALSCAALARMPPRPPELSSAESRLLRHLKEGLRNKEIAAAMGCAEVTVERDLTRLYRRFAVRGRAALLLLIG